MNHLLPHWMYCPAHDDVYRDYRMHDACDVRFATCEEIVGAS